MASPSIFNGKVIAITGASGTMGRALTQELARHGAKIVALTSSPQAHCPDASEIIQWTIGQEDELRDRFHSIDILILNHGVNVYGDRTPAAIQKSLDVNALSHWTLAELFFSTITDAETHGSSARDYRASTKELWVNTSEAEVSPALSPLYELSKRLIGHLITLRQLDAPCPIRKIILGPFKSELNPYGVMSPTFVAKAIAFLAAQKLQTIIVTVNPLTYLLFPLKEWSHRLYYQIFSHPLSPTPGDDLSRKRFR
ncbi:MAG: SDR family NAD(P)-dependent oxidoreductase [Symploca sp. SIO2B6]|nr:SDR family NAD(P)-dependent oxidoreductase [Symploca sp. SIO2B6]